MIFRTCLYLHQESKVLCERIFGKTLSGTQGKRYAQVITTMKKFVLSA